MTWRIAIPSYRRAATLAEMTLPLLSDRNVPADRIDVWLNDPDELDSYRDALDPTTYSELRTGGTPGSVASIRNAIVRGYETGTRLVSIDDDIVDVVRATGPKTLVPIADLSALIDLGYELASRAGAGLWGVYLPPNPYFMRRRLRTDLCYVCAGLHGITIAGDDTELVSLDDKEDFERSIKFYLRDGALARLDDISLQTAYYTQPGGMQETRTPDRITASARSLVDRFPELASLNTTKKSGHTEIRLRDRR